MVRDLEKVTKRFVREAHETLGAGLEAAALFGSAATGGYTHGRSDLNVLLVAGRIDRRELEALASRMKGWSRLGIAPPLLVDRSFLASSTDSYPLEILGMLSGYRVLLGADPLAGLSPDPVHVRIQTEREIKAKLLLLRRGYLESCGNRSALLAVLVGALPAVQAILRGILYIKGVDWKRQAKELHEASGALLHIDHGCLDAIAEARAGRVRPGRSATVELTMRLMDLLSSLAGVVEDAVTPPSRTAP